MSAGNSRQAPPPQGGLARLVSKFENLGASSKSNRNDGATYGTPDRALVDPSPTKAPPIHDEVKDGVETSKAATSPPPAPISASPAKRNDTVQSGPAVKDIHITNNVTPLLKPERPLARSGSVVAEMRRLFERGFDENSASRGLPNLRYPFTN